MDLSHSVQQYLIKGFADFNLVSHFFSCICLIISVSHRFLYSGLFQTILFQGESGVNYRFYRTLVLKYYYNSVKHYFKTKKK